MATDGTRHTVGRRPLLRRLGAGALLAGGSLAGGPAGAAASRAQASDAATSHTISVNSPSGEVVEYEFTFGVVLRPSEYAPPDVPHDAATIDPDDTVEGTAASGATAGGVDSYEYVAVLQSASVSNCGAANVWIDDEQVDPCGDLTGDLGSRTVSVNSPSGELVEYELSVAPSLEASTHAPPDVPHDEATVDPDDTVEGLTVSGATAGGVDSYEVAVGLDAFAANDCGTANVWIDGEPYGGCTEDGGNGDGGEDGDQDGDGDGSELPAVRTKLFASDGATDDQFGTAVAAAGDTYVVGAPYHDATGATFEYAPGDDGWQRTNRVTPADVPDWLTFGRGLALADGTAVVGAPSPTTDDPQAVPGRTFLFDANGDGWSEAARLTDTDEPLAPAFGQAVACDGTTTVVGWYDQTFGDGVAYAFEGGEEWSLADQLLPEDRSLLTGYGSAVAVSDGTVLVGEPEADGGGVVHAFASGDGGWSQQGTIAPDDGVDGDDFGAAVALEGDTALVGAPEAPGGSHSGAAYVFEATGSGWQQRQRLAPDGLPGADGFGRAVALEGDLAAFGAPAAETDAGRTGAVFAFADDGSGWQQRQDAIVPDDAADGDRFGRSVGLAGGTAFVGAPAADGEAAETGAAYVVQVE